MFNKAGFRFATTPKKFCELMHQQIAAITLYHKMSNDKFKIHDNYRRNTFRVPITSDLPPHLLIKVYMRGEDGMYHGCNLMDISAGGFCVVAPFENRPNLFKSGTKHRFVFEFAREKIECDATVTHAARVDLSGKAKQFMQKLGKIKPPGRNDPVATAGGF